jgi:hypothetical protein
VADYPERVEAAEGVDQFLGNAVGKIFLAFVTGLIGKGQHGDDRESGSNSRSGHSVRVGLLPVGDLTLGR